MFGDVPCVSPERIQVSRKLASGGYGDVYACRLGSANGDACRLGSANGSLPLSPSLSSAYSSPLAIKKSFGHKDTNGILFYRELNLLAMFDHPNIIQLVGVAVKSDDPTKLADWERLDAKTAQSYRSDDIYLLFPLAKHDLACYPTVEIGPDKILTSALHLKSEDEIIALFRQIVSAVDYVHACGYVHRDIKPSNVLVMEDDTLRLCDFGCSEKLFRFGYLGEGVGSMMFRAPETILPVKKGTVTNSYGSDIWSLGCVLYYMLSAYSFLYNLPTTEPDQGSWAEAGNYAWEMQATIYGYPFPICIPEHLQMPGIKYVSRVGLDEFMGRCLVPLRNSSVTSRFLAKMLHLNPDQRVSARELLLHPYMAPRGERSRNAARSPSLPFSSLSLFS